MSTTSRLTKCTCNQVGPAIVAVLITAAIGAGCARIGSKAPSDTGSTSNPTATSAHTGEPVTYAGGLATPRPSGAPVLDGAAAAAQVMEGMSGDPQLTGITADLTPSGLDVEVTLTRNDDRVPDVWLADVAIGAVGELVRSDQAVISDLISTATAVGPGDGGALITTHLGIGAVRLGQVFGSPSDADLGARVGEIAMRYGLEVADLKILHPLETALSVTFVVPEDLAINWTIDQLRSAIAGTSPDVEGVFIQLDDEGGQPLLQTGSAYRTGEGGLWFALGQDERFGANHGHYLDLGD